MLLGEQKRMIIQMMNLMQELKKDMDAGENPTTKIVAPGNIKNDSTDEKDQKYLTYLKSIMDEKAIETVKNRKFCDQSRRCPLYDSKVLLQEVNIMIWYQDSRHISPTAGRKMSQHIQLLM